MQGVFNVKYYFTCFSRVRGKEWISVMKFSQKKKKAKRNKGWLGNPMILPNIVYLII